MSISIAAAVFKIMLSVNGRSCPECREQIPAKVDSSRLVNNLISELLVRCTNSIVPSDTAEQTPSKKKARSSSSSSTCTASNTVDLPASSDHCSWTGALKDLDSHFTVCGFTVTKCSCDGCNISMERRKLGDHEAICSHRLLIAGLTPFFLYKAATLAFNYIFNFSKIELL
jgi:hypothetical protein